MESMYSEAAVAGRPVEEKTIGEVSELVLTLDRGLTRLGEQIDSLTERLRPVLREEIKPADLPGDQRAPTLTPLGENLANLAARIEALQACAATTYRRVAL